jgi:dipeptidyl aminopeptidase/acylaminoacyl peptidase
MNSIKKSAVSERLICSILAILMTASGAAAKAQSGSPAPMEPMKHHDARVGNLLEMLGKARTPRTAAISPNGQYVAWTVSGRGGDELHLTGLAPEGTAQDGAWDRILSPDTIGNVTNGKPGLCYGAAPIWSPDGKQLAFLSNCLKKDGKWETEEQSQLFQWTLASNEMKQISDVTGTIDQATWSPDGKTIGFLFVENATRTAGALAAMKPWSGVIGEDGIEVQRVAAVDPSTSKMSFLTPASLHVYEFGWSPDSGTIAYVAANPPGENTWWIAQLYRQGVSRTGASPSAPVSILDPQKVAGSLHGLQIAVPRWSPDGTKIAFIGGLMSDQGATGGDAYVVSADGGEPVDITPGIDGSATYLVWLNDNRVGLVEQRRGHILLPDYDVAKRQLIEGSVDDLGEVSISGGAIEDAISYAVTRESGLQFALVKSNFSTPPEVFVGPLAHLRQLTHLNDALKPAWGKTESIEWTNDGFKVQGWLLYPADYDPAKKYPLVVSVHGGPSSAVTPHWPGVGYGGVPFSALGYFVFMPNPRGSYGQGEAFTQANRKDFGYGDLRDILAGMDVLEKRLPIDKTREGLTGWSYGGFMTMFGVTQTTRFRAAVAGAGISNWKSYYGENSIDQWMVPFFGKTVYDDPAVYAKSSAIEYMHKVKTPTLIVVGDRDGECPAPQSFEFWHALRAEGVKTQLVVYPNEGHGFRDPEHRRDVLERALAWFETEMPETKK